MSFYFLVSHHGNILSRLFESVFDPASDVPQVRQGELFELRRAQNSCVGLEHL